MFLLSEALPGMVEEIRFKLVNIMKTVMSLTDCVITEGLMM